MSNETKIIVAGGRDFNDFNYLNRMLFEIGNKYENASIVSGCAAGADNLAIVFAQKHNIILHKFPANWSRDGKAAGFVRNVEMANFADVLVAFWDGKSKGTEHMIKTMQNKNKPTYIFNY